MSEPRSEDVILAVYGVWLGFASFWFMAVAIHLLQKVG